MIFFIQLVYRFCRTDDDEQQVGLRGYLATRQMILAGMDACNMSGGYRSWQTQFKSVVGSKI